MDNERVVGYYPQNIQRGTSWFGWVLVGYLVCRSFFSLMQYDGWLITMVKMIWCVDASKNTSNLSFWSRITLYSFSTTSTVRRITSLKIIINRGTRAKEGRKQNTKKVCRPYDIMRFAAGRMVVKEWVLIRLLNFWSWEDGMRYLFK